MNRHCLNQMKSKLNLTKPNTPYIPYIPWDYVKYNMSKEEKEDRENLALALVDFVIKYEHLRKKIDQIKKMRLELLD